MKLHIGMLVRSELLRQERSVAWFARKICCTRTHAYKIFEKENMDIELLMRISNALDHDFFADISDNMCKEIGDTTVL